MQGAFKPSWQKQCKQQQWQHSCLQTTTSTLQHLLLTLLHFQAAGSSLCT
jgi:hypothetical protein